MEKKNRFSAARNFLMQLFEKSEKPLSVFDLQKLFDKNKLPVNKTTIYRELDFLKNKKIISEMHLKGNKRWYELSSKKHHHHIICINCDKVEDFAECDSENLINKALRQSPGFVEIINHNFDFYGLCKSCVKK